MDFKALTDRADRSCLYATLFEFGIPVKLKKLGKLTLYNIRSNYIDIIGLNKRKLIGLHQI